MKNNNLQHTSVIVLASGAGTRLGDITLTKPKPMLEFGGKPFLAFLLDWLLRSGVHDIVITTYTYAEQIHKFIKNEPKYAGKVTAIMEPNLVNTVQSTKIALEYITKPTSFLMTADNLWAVSLHDVYEQHIMRQAKITVLTTARAGVPNLGAVNVRDDNSIAQMWPSSEGNSSNEDNLRLASTMGLYLLNSEALRKAICAADVSIEREPMNRLRPDVYAHWCEGFFFDFGTPDNYLWLKKHSGVIEKYFD